LLFFSSKYSIPRRFRSMASSSCFLARLLETAPVVARVWHGERPPTAAKKGAHRMGVGTFGQGRLK
jgi:hypothetical protein